MFFFIYLGSVEVRNVEDFTVYLAGGLKLVLFFFLLHLLCFG